MPSASQHPEVVVGAPANAGHHPVGASVAPTEAGPHSSEPVQLTGEHGLLSPLVIEILQLDLDIEMNAHVSRRLRADAGGVTENVRNGDRPKRLLTDLGAVELRMPRDRHGTFDPAMVPKHGRSLSFGTAGLAGLYAGGLSPTEIHAELNRMAKHRLDPETTETLTEELEPIVKVWQHRRLDRAYPVLLIDSISLGTSGRHFLDAVLAINGAGNGELLGIWRRPSPLRRPAPGHLRVLEELRDRGVTGVQTIVAAEVAHLSVAARGVWAEADVRTGVEALVGNTIRGRRRPEAPRPAPRRRSGQVRRRSV